MSVTNGVGGVSGKILLIEDESAFARVLTRILKQNKYDVVLVGTLREANEEIASAAPDVVLADIGLPDGSGAEILDVLARIAPETPTILMTAQPSVESAVLALRNSAFDYLTKPFTEVEVLLILKRALEVSRLRRELRRLRDAAGAEADDRGLIGHSAAVRSIREKIGVVAPTETTILITGETGVGKERVARLLHTASRRKGPFVALNCSAIPEMLVESELFGAKKGSFTGSVADKRGLVGEAVAGTLFLDEIGDMPLFVQPKLLRLLQEKTYRAIGDEKEQQADIRVIAATHRNLRDEVERGRFREDLYWRLAVIEIGIPPLRERPDDIVLLVAHILSALACRHNRTVPPVSPEALEALRRHTWPGNVRELENALERALLFQRGAAIEERDIDFLPGIVEGAPLALDAVLARQQEVVERQYLMKVLLLTKGAVDQAAELAGRNRTAFYRLLQKHGISPEQFREKSPPSK